MGEQNVNSSVRFIHVVTLTFVVLKLTKVIDWSWLLVLLPSIAHIVISLLVNIGIFVFYWWIYRDR